MTAILRAEELPVKSPQVALRDGVAATVELRLLPIVLPEVEDDLRQVSSNDHLPIAAADYPAMVEEVAKRHVGTRGPIAAHEPKQAAAFELLGNRDARRLEHGRADIERADDRPDARIRRNGPRPSEHERHTKQLLVYRVAVAPGPVLLELLAVIRGDHDDRVFVEPQLS